MRAVGSPAAGWIAGSIEEYVDLAVAAAEDLQRLAAMRPQLRPAMLRSSLCDGTAFISLLEDAYAGMWQQRWRKQHGQEADAGDSS